MLIYGSARSRTLLTSLTLGSALRKNLLTSFAPRLPFRPSSELLHLLPDPSSDLRRRSPSEIHRGPATRVDFHNGLTLGLIHHPGTFDELALRD